MALALPIKLDGDRIKITQEFGEDFEWQGFTQFYRQNYGLTGHNGIDFGGWDVRGEPVLSPGDGTVIFADWGANWPGSYNTVGGGAYVVGIDHGNVVSALLHLEAYSNTVVVGQRVKKGQVVAKAGSTGVGTGAHLHWQVMPKPIDWGNNWGCVNPRYYMTESVSSTIKEITLDIKEVIAAFKQYGWWYKGAGKRDAWNYLVNAAKDSAYRVVREPITVTDVDGKKVKAQLAAFIGTIWRRVHRDIPKSLNGIAAEQKAQTAKLDTLITLVGKPVSLTAEQVDAIVDASIRENVPGVLDENVPALLENALEDSVIDVQVTVKGRDQESPA